MPDTASELRQAIRDAGMEPPEVIVPNRVHRFPGKGKPRGNKAGWCILFEGERRGLFGDGSRGYSQHWRAGRRCPFLAERKRPQFFREPHAASRQEFAARRAARIWERATTASADHPYLKRKGIRPHGARLHKGCLVLPVVDFTGHLASLQFIDRAGDKRFLAGGRKQGCFIPVAWKAKDPLRIVICEGWATGCTLAEDDPRAMVLAAMDAGNLAPVALATRNCWPHATLIIAADDDRLTPGNPGLTRGKEAALLADAQLAVPQWPSDAPSHLTDFNDLATWLTARVRIQEAKE